MGKSTNTYKNRHLERPKKDAASAYVFKPYKPGQFLEIDDVLAVLQPEQLKTKEEMQKEGIWEDWIKEHPEENKKEK